MIVFQRMVLTILNLINIDLNAHAVKWELAHGMQVQSDTKYWDFVKFPSECFQLFATSVDLEEFERHQTNLNTNRHSTVKTNKYGILKK